MNFIDAFLNGITMYRLMLYFLRLLFGVALLFCFLGILPYEPLALFIQLVMLMAACLATNLLLSRLFGVVTNYESAYISALILCLIITPSLELPSIVFLGVVGVLAMASKFLVAPYHKHIFNPVALAVALTLVSMGQGASWWIGNLPMLPLIAFGGALIIRKLRRVEMTSTLLLLTALTTTLYAWQIQENPLPYLIQAFVYSPLLFFAFVMHSEPLTTPPKRIHRIIYGALVGVLLSPQLGLWVQEWISLTPELALLMGNVYSYAVSPKLRLTLILQEKRNLAQGVIELAFKPGHSVRFQPGQYLEWTLPVPHMDNRGNRRFFTIASSPTEELIRVGVRLFDKPSQFKQHLHQMQPGDRIVASQLTGDFTLPSDAQQKLVFIAGGIGVTPFRSMIKYLIDKGEKRDIVLFYSAKTQDEIAYAELWQEAEKLIGLRYIPLYTDGGDTLSPELLSKALPDFKERIFYLSGPHGMVVAFEKMLADLGVSKQNIRTDYFPGFV